VYREKSDAKIWSTEQVPPRDRLALWVDAVCDNLVHVDCEPRRDQLFSGQLRIDVVSLFRVATITSTAALVTRSPRQIARDAVDNFVLAIHQAGDATMIQYGRDAVPKPGDLVLHDMTRPWRIHIGGDFTQTLLLFPRTRLLRRLGHAEPYLGMRIDGTVGVAGMLSPLLRQLPSHLDGTPAATRERVAENLLDLIATALVSTGNMVPLSAGMTLARVKLWLETHLDEELSAERIAAQCRLSVRHLNRLFAREGTSLMHHVWERRLARCHADLTDPAMHARSITEIAFAAGFNDLSHFSRSYRARHGCAPRETRDAAAEK
jgi:AraC-like DNA-binding protein